VTGHLQGSRIRPERNDLRGIFG